MNNTLYDAYWISPSGQFFGVTKHIHFISSNLELFGISRNEYEETFKFHNEKFGIEGKARLELMKKALVNGWTRARYYENKGWTIEIFALNDTIKNHLFKFIKEVSRMSKSLQRFEVKVVELHILSAPSLNEYYDCMVVPLEFDYFLSEGAPACRINYE
ncbi:hypothetical protein MASR1M45_02090 [Candidatus Kapaibacterium sp.]